VILIGRVEHLCTRIGSLKKIMDSGEESVSMLLLFKGLKEAVVLLGKGAKVGIENRYCTQDPCMSMRLGGLMGSGQVAPKF
jgi:hypothetical protein